MPLTTYEEDLLVNSLFGGVAYTPPATLYFGLSTTLPTAAGGNITEPAIGTNGYARVAVTNNTSNFASTSSDAKTNTTAITFPTSTGSWASGGSLAYLCIYDAATGGNLIGYSTLNNPQTVSSSGATLSFAASALSVVMS